MISIPQLSKNRNYLPRKEFNAALNKECDPILKEKAGHLFSLMDEKWGLPSYHKLKYDMWLYDPSFKVELEGRKTWWTTLWEGGFGFTDTWLRKCFDDDGNFLGVPDLLIQSPIDPNDWRFVFIYGDSLLDSVQTKWFEDRRNSESEKIERMICVANENCHRVSIINDVIRSNGPIPNYDPLIAWKKLRAGN